MEGRSFLLEDDVPEGIRKLYTVCPDYDKQWHMRPWTDIGEEVPPAVICELDGVEIEAINFGGVDEMRDANIKAYMDKMSKLFAKWADKRAYGGEMKRLLIVLMTVLLILSLSACASESEEELQNQNTAQEETTPDADWNLPETTEMTDEVAELFDKAMEVMTGVVYEPVGFLGEKDGIYCILCRANVVYPDTKPYYSLVYVNDEGIQNIWDIWMGAHAEKKD